MKGALLHEKIVEELFMQWSKGFKDGTGRLLMLSKSLFGLKQVPDVWNQTATLFIKTLWLKATNEDKSTFFII